ncbi:MAG: O-antigen/teichoic acid export membrane protein [Acidimicrobiales bacterium]|jgi:O-antigen/teichoic acid export membrane protein
MSSANSLNLSLPAQLPMGSGMARAPSTINTSSERSGQLARDSAVAMVTTWTTYVAGAVGGLVLARTLSPEGKGLYALLFLAGILAGAAGTFGTDLWSTKEAANQGIAGNVPEVVKFHLEMVTMVLVVLGLAAWLVTAPILGRPAPTGLIAVLVLTIASVWAVSLAALMRGTRDMRNLLKMHALTAAVFLFGIGCLAAMDRITVLSALYLASGAKVIGSFVGPWKHVLTSQRATVDVWWAVVRGHVSSSVGVLAEFVSYRVDILFVALFLSTTEVGLYSVALPLSELLWLIPNALAQVLLPHVAKSGSSEATVIAIRLATLTSIVGAAILVLFAIPILHLLYGDAYRDAAVTIPFLAGGAVVLTVWKLVTTDLLARGHSSIRAHGGVLGIAVLCATLPILAPRFGLRGAAASSMLAYAAAATHGITRWKQLPGSNVRDLIPGRKEDWLAIRRFVVQRSTKMETT